MSDEAWNMSEHSKMERYPDNEDEQPKYVAIKSIVVPSQRDKNEILLALKYLHDNRTIDTDYYAVNTLVHMYLRPDLIIVENHDS